MVPMFKNRGVAVMTGVVLLAGILAGRNVQAAEFSHAAIDGVLKTYVANGRVDYPRLKQNRQPLDQYVASLGSVQEADFASWDEPTQIAFWINAYNAITMKVILDHYPITKKNIPAGLPFPVNSIRQIPGQWDKITHSIMGKPMTLNDIEHQTLRKKYREPRIHMALVCAARGCPILRSEAYDGKRLGQQLDEQARAYFSTPAGLKLDKQGKTVAISSILQWFGEDFLKVYGNPKEPTGLTDKRRAAVAFVGRYAGTEDQAFLKKGDYRLSFLGYDWSLNKKE